MPEIKSDNSRMKVSGAVFALLFLIINHRWRLLDSGVLED